MIWALLALLGVPLWLIVGVLAAGLWSRRRFKRQPGVFRLKFRESDEARWSRRFSYGRIVHDVLVVNAGLALIRTGVFGISSVSEVRDAGSTPPFDDARVYELTFDDGSERQIAVDESAAAAVARLTAPPG
jgi:hypothetical protein